MDYSLMSKRISGSGSEVWVDHYAAVERRAAGEDVIVMSVGDPDFDTPKIVVQSAIDALMAGDTHYTDVTGRHRIREAVARRIGNIVGIDCTAANVGIAAGTQNALYSAAALLLNPGDEVIVLEPVFSTYTATIESTGAVVVPVSCPIELKYQPDIFELKEAITSKTKAIFYASPSNPTGAAITRENLKAISEIARECDLWIVSDEIYCEFIFEDDHHSIASLPGMRERTIIVGSLSKTYAMTGWRVGWVIGPTRFIELFGNLNLANTFGLPGFLQEAGATALEVDLVEVAQMREAFRKRRDVAMNILQNAPNLSVVKPAAGMFLMVDVRNTGLSSAEFKSNLYQSYGVSVLDGKSFGESADGSVRVSFAIDEAELVKGCERIVALATELSDREARDGAI